MRFQRFGLGADSGFGSAVSAAGDVSRDGTPDFAVSTATARVNWYRGEDGSLFLFVIRNGCFGESLAPAGDLDGDLVPDLLVGDSCAINPDLMKSTGCVTVLSGRTGASLRTTYGDFECAGFGHSIAAAADTNADGTLDYLAGAPLGSCIPPGYTYYMLLSGSTGLSLDYGSSWDLSGAVGSALAFVGDIDGDGRSDYLVADAGAARADLKSGLNGSLIRRLTGTGGYGRSAAGLGDIDGDGVPDFAVGAPSGQGAVYIYSGRTRALLRTQAGSTAQDQFGTRIEGIGDVSGDGVPDYIVGAPRMGTLLSGSAYVYSGRDGGLLCEIGGGPSGDYLGASLARIGDLDGDGRDEFAVGAPGTPVGNQFNVGRAAIYGVSLGAPVGLANGLHVTKGPSGIDLAWNPPGPCNSGTDYAVYRGTLGSLAHHTYDHAPLICSTGGSTHYTVTASGGDADYFLVAATALNEEGGLGTDSAGRPIPMGAPACYPFRNLTTCP